MLLSIPAPTATNHWRVAVLLTTGLLIGATAVLGWRWNATDTSVRNPVTQFVVPVNGGLFLRSGSGLAISPDRDTLAFASATHGPQQTYVRRLDDPESVALPGTARSAQPAFSPGGGEVRSSPTAP